MLTRKILKILKGQIAILALCQYVREFTRLKMQKQNTHFPVLMSEHQFIKREIRLYPAFNFETAF